MILVTGATGNIGGPLVTQLLGSGERVRVRARDVARARARLPTTVDIVGADTPLVTALAGCDRAFFLDHAGPGLADAGAVFAAAARDAGVRHVVVVSSGTIEMQPPTRIGTWHLALEHAFAGMACTFLRPDNFASNAQRWATMIRERGMVFLPNPDGRSVPIDPADIAAVAHAALVEPGHAGKTYTLSGPQVMTARDQVAALAEVLGKPVQLVAVPVERARAGMIGAGMSAEMADAVLELIGHEPRPTTTVREVTGREPRTFAAWAAEHRAGFSE
jgi:uncharacterized protein YbjT (DUF2867 family)